jgi:hypothetical protein
LVFVPQHAHLAVSGPRLSRRERWLIGGVLAVVAALVLALAISLATAGPTSSHGCIYVTIPAATGAQEINQCGGTARSTCASALRPGSFPAQSARVVAAECRKAGLPVD